MVVYFYFSANFREQEWYKKGVQMFHQYKPAEDYLGSPVSNGHVNLSKLMVIECEANVSFLTYKSLFEHSKIFSWTRTKESGHTFNHCNT